MGIGVENPEPLASGSRNSATRKLGASFSEANVTSQLLDLEVDDVASLEEKRPVEAADQSALDILEKTHADVDSVMNEVMFRTFFQRLDSNQQLQVIATDAEVLTLETITENPVEVRKETPTNLPSISETEFPKKYCIDVSKTVNSVAMGSANTLDSMIGTMAQSSDDVSSEADEVEAALQEFSNERDATPASALPPNYPPTVYPPVAASSSSEPPPAQNNDVIFVDGDSGVPVQDHDNDMVDDDLDDASSEDDLEDALQGDFDFKGSFYHAATVPTAPNPCLNIDGLGHVGLPLSTRDARAIIECSARAPFGHGERTVVDTKVRDTWEIEPAKVKFDNPAWADFVRTQVVRTVWEALGVAPSAVAPRCELYKLLLYEEGSHFLPHQDTEKADGMFATVIIVLPSLYTGGEVHVSHSSSTKVIELAPNSLLYTSVLAWYTDVRHEVKPITSGYRLALSYNLIHAVPGVPRPTLPDMNTAVNRLRHVLRKWHKEAYGNEEMDDNLVAYLLEHEYSVANLQAGAKILKGADAHLVANLRDVAEDLGYMVCLANLEYHVHGCADDDYGYRSYGKRERYNRYGGYGNSSDDDDDRGTPGMGEIMETNLTLQNLVDLEGNSLLGHGSLGLSQENLIPKEPFEDETPDDTDYEGYMGNGAGSLDHWYRRTVLVLVHEDDAPQILFSAGGVQYALQRLKKSASDIPTSDDKDMAGRVLNVLSANDKATATLMSDYALKWKDLGMWKTVIKKSGSLPTFGADELIRAWKTFTFEGVRLSFEEILQSTTRLSDQINFILTLPQHASPEELEQIRTWAEGQAIRAFASFKSPTIEDIPVLVAVGRTRGAVFIAKEILPQLVKNPSIYAFAIAFLRSLHEHKNSIPEHPAATADSTADMQPAEKKVYQNLVEELLNTAVAQWDSVVAQPNPHYGSYYNRQSSASDDQKVKRIIELVELCLLTGHMRPCNKLFLRLLQIRGSTVQKFQALYTPLVPRLRDVMRTKGIALLSSPFSDFLQLLVGSYLRDILGVQGQNYSSKLRKIGCGCADCALVDSFIMSTTKAQETFRLVQARRLHLEKRLCTAPDILSFVTIRSGSPHGVAVTKRPEIVSAQQWQTRVAQAKVFMRNIGDDDAISQLMGNRYGDVMKALTGLQPFALTVGDAARNPPATAPSQIPSALPATAPPPSLRTSAAVASSSSAGAKRKNPPVVHLGVIDLTGDD
ncbi:hypothetical protein D9615_004868 [Tricholomella constricta]|uniref:Prolyl 4-hydroxylase alpha subunit Fe(2+) 2OG dioxygenase domain-containing protein n=1 Tax=Tricholomella constricta TaxID=117010 RepID=A0A8H5HHC8_9AGAR|nr:hypothetical protein D9615_004868 [Tricholomella constricta]